MNFYLQFQYNKLPRVKATSLDGRWDWMGDRLGWEVGLDGRQAWMGGGIEIHFWYLSFPPNGAYIQ